MIDETVNYDSGIRNYNRMLEGKRAFITTAARGIGKSIAILFARQGATVYFAGRNECYVRETESELQHRRAADIYATSPMERRARRRPHLFCVTAAESIF